MKRGKTYRALLTSILSLLLCVSMLVGTTYAWFTDSVTSGNNIIQAGNLDVTLEYANAPDGTYTSVEGVDDIFVAPAGSVKGLWEPGHTEIAYLKVNNEGSLDLKYNIKVAPSVETEGVNADGDPIVLSEILRFGATEPSATAPIAYTRETAREAADGAVKLNEYAKNEVALAAGESQYIAVVVYMPETVGNEANYVGTTAPQIEFTITLLATQLTSEQDSFGDDYDAGALQINEGQVYVPASSTENLAVTAGDVKANIPAGAQEGNYKLSATETSTTMNNDGSRTVAYDIKLYRDGVAVSGVPYEVKIALDPMQTIRSFSHNGQPIAYDSYDALSGILTFTTDSFSLFEITCADIEGENIKVEDGKLVSGTFVGSNPVAIDPALAQVDSEYVAVNYEKNGETAYVISKRSETVVLYPAGGSYTVINDDPAVVGDEYKTIAVGSNQMYQVISDLQNNEFTNVYILPGKYQCNTTVNVYSSMNIVGLGNAQDIELIKGSASSNHLLNCNGSKEDYIQVTIRNLYLNVAVGASTKKKDNAAVQSIRKSKVKCYDLIVYKNEGQNFNNAAFYVNANNKVTENPDTYSNAYLYVENTVINGKAMAVSTMNGNSTAGYTKYYFNHSGLTYSNGTKTYTINSGNTKNVVMAEDDWTWEE